MFPGKESPWSILGLDSTTATARDVKRAYAGLLKKHRPDADPEGFRRIHDAYQTLLHELELRDNPESAAPEPILPSNEPASSAEPSPPPRDEPPLPLPFTAAAKKLQAMRSAGSYEDAAEVFTQLRLVCGTDPALWRSWSRMLNETFPHGLGTAGIAPHIPVEDILSELRAGSDGVAGQVLDHWQKARNIAAMTTAGRALTAKGAEKEYDHPTSGRFALRLAFNLSIAQPGGANLLLDAAFRWLPPQLRTHLLPGVENRLNIGRFFWHVPAVWQPFWENVFDDLDAERKPDWDNANARRALQDLQRVTPADWPGWGFLQANLPMRQWDDVVSYFNSRPPSRRGWTTPPEKQWINLAGETGFPSPTQPGSTHNPHSLDLPDVEMDGSPRKKSPYRSSTSSIPTAREDDLWDIPDEPARPPSRPITEQDRARPSRSAESTTTTNSDAQQSNRRRRTSQPQMHASHSGRYSSRGRRLDPNAVRGIGCFIFILIKIILLIVHQASKH